MSKGEINTQAASEMLSEVQEFERAQLRLAKNREAKVEKVALASKPDKGEDSPDPQDDLNPQTRPINGSNGFVWSVALSPRWFGSEKIKSFLSLPPQCSRSRIPHRFEQEFAGTP